MTKFCVQCGAPVTDTARFCNKCGAQLQPAQPTAAVPQAVPTNVYDTPPNYQQQYQPPNSGQTPYQMPYQQPYQPAPVANELKPNVAGALCYPLSFVTGILFLVLTPYNRGRFVRFHAYQSIFFFAAMLALYIGAGVLSIVSWRLGRTLNGLVDLFAFAGSLWMMYQAYRGEKFKMPVIGDLAETQADKIGT